MSFFNQLLVLLLFATFNSSAQLSKKLSFNFELSSNNTNVTLRDSWPIRQDVGASYYNNNNNSNRVYTDMYFTQFGIRPEYELVADKLSVSTGLRFTHLLSEIAKFDAESGGYFFLRYGTEPLSTEYARIKSINEETAYLGVPLEFQLTPFRYYKFAPYLRVGSEIGFKISTSNEIDFYSQSMEIYADEIIEQHGFEPQNIFATIYSAVGFSLGSAGKINYNFEFLLPSFFLTNKNSSLFEIEKFSGFRFSLKLPLSAFSATK